MKILFDILLLLFLFGLLGLAADFVVKNIKYLALILKVKLFAFGIILGLITTIPELSLGINATINEVSAISVGNLLSGIIIIFGLVLGASLILNRKISTDSKWRILIPQALIIFFPVLLGLDGGYGVLDGIIMVLAYFILLVYLYYCNQSYTPSYLEVINKNKIAKAIFISLAGIIFILLSSHWIISISLDLLKYIKISELVIGALVFAIGTNLPEITIAITSWRKKASKLSLSHLLSSAFTNTLALGVLAVIRPIVFEVDSAFWILSSFLVISVVLFLIFYQSGKKMDRREGFILLSVYLLFLIINILFLNK